MRQRLDSANTAHFQRIQSDPRPILLRRTRRSLIVVLGLAAAAMGVWVLTATDDVLINAGLPIVCLSLVGHWISRRGTRALAQVPSRLLDERQLHEVHSAARRGHRIAVLVIAVLGLISVFQTLRIGVAGLLLLVSVVAWLPTAVLAWRMEDEEPAEPSSASA